LYSQRIKINLAGSYVTWLQAIVLLSYKRINTNALISKTISLEELPEAFEEMEKTQHLKNTGKD